MCSMMGDMDTNQTYKVPDGSVNADVDMQDDKDQALQDAYSAETAPEFMGMPQEDLRERLDELAADDQEGDASASNPQADDFRERIEDMDQGDPEAV